MRVILEIIEATMLTEHTGFVYDVLSFFASYRSPYPNAIVNLVDASTGALIYLQAYETIWVCQNDANVENTEMGARGEGRR